MDDQTFSNDLAKLRKLANKFQAATAEMVEAWKELEAFRFTVKGNLQPNPDASTPQSVSP